MVVSISSIDTLDLFSAILSAVGGGGNGTGKIFLFLLHRLQGETVTHLWFLCCFDV
jgi:predicted alternative tryptophan synthase beta-subunit